MLLNLPGPSSLSNQLLAMCCNVRTGPAKLFMLEHLYRHGIDVSRMPMALRHPIEDVESRMLNPGCRTQDAEPGMSN
jgi:hypothetical protein